MSVNTFNQLHLEALQSMMPEGVMVKRSSVFTNAVVIGHPEVPGSVLLSLATEEDEEGRFEWLSSFFPNHQPKEVADGKVELQVSYTDRFFHWGEMSGFISSLSLADFSEQAYMKM